MKNVSRDWPPSGLLRGIGPLRSPYFAKSTPVSLPPRELPGFDAPYHQGLLRNWPPVGSSILPNWPPIFAELTPREIMALRRVSFCGVDS